MERAGRFLRAYRENPQWFYTHTCGRAIRRSLVSKLLRFPSVVGKKRLCACHDDLWVFSWTCRWDSLRVARTCRTINEQVGGGKVSCEGWERRYMYFGISYPCKIFPSTRWLDSAATWRRYMTGSWELSSKAAQEKCTDRLIGCDKPILYC